MEAWGRSDIDAERARCVQDVSEEDLIPYVSTFKYILNIYFKITFMKHWEFF